MDHVIYQRQYFKTMIEPFVFDNTPKVAKWDGQPVDNGTLLERMKDVSISPGRIVDWKPAGMTSEHSFVVYSATFGTPDECVEIDHLLASLCVPYYRETHSPENAYFR